LGHSYTKRKPRFTEISSIGIFQNWTSKDPWYDRGVVHFQGLGWIGDVTFKNSKIAPAYIFRRDSHKKIDTLVATAASLTDTGAKKPCAEGQRKPPRGGLFPIDILTLKPSANALEDKPFQIFRAPRKQ
jgi:hypothetical protein